jgi:ribose transport system permease protein
VSTVPTQGNALEAAAATAAAAAAADKDLMTGGESAGKRWLRRVAPTNIGAIYVWIVIIILFSIISPDVFPTAQTAKSVVNQYAITGIVALSLVVPLAAGVYDLSIGFVLSFSGIIVADLLATTSMSPLEASLVAMLACVAIGLINAFIVVVMRVNSFIATLGSGAIVASLTTAISNDAPIVGRVGENPFDKIASINVFSNITLPVFYLLILMVIVGYWLERTSSGRQLYATGFDVETSRLTGAPTKRLTAVSLVTSATIAGFAGLVLAARVSSADPNAGAAYLIPAFSAAFLGATQFRGGRFNSWGTVVAVMLLGTGDVGLLVSGGPTWTPPLFEGVVLIAAVALTVQRTKSSSGLAQRWRARSRSADAPARDGADASS